MVRSALLLSGVVSVLACAPSFANTKLTGFGEVGLGYGNYDAPSDFDVTNFHGRGAALWTWPEKWNVQGEFSFDSLRLDGPFTADVVKFGAGVFWRDPNQYMYGGELRYQSLDFVAENDGVGLTGRGEYYWRDATLGGYLGYSSYDGPVVELDGWQFGAQGSYYLEPKLALRADLNFGFWERNGVDADEWSLNGEVEYLLDDCDTSVYAGLGFGGLDPDIGGEQDVFQIGAGLRVHFGTDGSLANRNRNEPLAAIGRSHFTF